MKIGFIGAGNMGGALATAAARAVGGACLRIADANAEKAAALAAQIGAVTVADNAAVAAQCDYIFLGVKPQMMQAMLTDLKPSLKANTVLITMAAGLTTDQIRAWAGDLPVIRIMPNTPVAVGEGMTLYTATPDVTASQLDGFVAMMAQSGKLCYLPESLIDSGCAVSGCGPAFVYLFIEALTAGGVEKGLSREQSLQLAAQTVLGAAQMVLETGRDPIPLKDAVCSPGGATLQGVAALERCDLHGTVLSAVDAAYKRTLELKG